MKKICQRCQSSFNCREDRIEFCSCRKVTLVSGVRDYIKESYEDCLCPNCLKETNTYFYALDVNPRFLKSKK